MLEVRRLQVLIELDACGSFSAAAQALHLTQPAVSQHVAALEREIGLALVERGTRPVGLTEAGHALVRHARLVIARLEDAEQELEHIAGRWRGRLRFGSFPTALATFVPAAVASLKQHHPFVTLTVIDDHLQRLLPRLQNGELDLALIYDHEALPHDTAAELDLVHLRDDQFHAVLPARHRLARSHRGVKLEQLADDTWIGGGPTSAWFQIVRHSCHQAGFEPRVAFNSDDNVAVQAFTAAGLGVSVIPGLAVRHPLPGVEIRPLLTHTPVRRISVARPAAGFRSPASHTMVELLKHAAAQQPDR
jgi:DNA-binding transcriptional LysR family regulator